MIISGEKLKQLRTKAGLRQKTLAHMLGVSQGFITLDERGDRNLSPQNAEKLSSILSCNVNDLSKNDEQAPYRQIVQLADKLTEERQRIVLQIIREFLF